MHTTHHHQQGEPCKGIKERFSYIRIFHMWFDQVFIMAIKSI